MFYDLSRQFSVASREKLLRWQSKYFRTNHEKSTQSSQGTNRNSGKQLLLKAPGAKRGN